MNYKIMCMIGTEWLIVVCSFVAWHLAFGFCCSHSHHDTQNVAHDNDAQGLLFVLLGFVLWQ